MTRIRSTRLGVAGATLVAAIGLAACGTETVDSGELESQLTDQLSADAGLDPADVSISCPDDVEVEEGRQFECTLIAPDGDEARVDVTLTDDEGGFRAVVAPEQPE